MLLCEVHHTWALIWHCRCCRLRRSTNKCTASTTSSTGVGRWINIHTLCWSLRAALVLGEKAVNGRAAFCRRAPEFKMTSREKCAALFILITLLFGWLLLFLSQMCPCRRFKSRLSCCFVFCLVQKWALKHSPWSDETPKRRVSTWRLAPGQLQQGPVPTQHYKLGRRWCSQARCTTLCIMCAGKYTWRQTSV